MTVAFHEVRRIPATACSCDYHPAHSVCTIIPATSERVSALEDALDSPYCSDLQSSPRRNVLSREEMTMSKESLLLSRRRLLRAGIFIAGTVANLGKPTLATAGSNDQPDWRFCNKCEVMFFNGYGNKGRCAAGGAHVAQGYNFVLPHPPYGCSHCNDGSCQCGYGTGADLCANHRGDDPKIGCIQQQ